MPHPDKDILPLGVYDTVGDRYVAILGSSVTTINGIPYASIVAYNNAIAQSGYITIGSGTLTASTDTTFTFSSRVNHLFIQNNTSSNVQFELDQTSNAGSPLLLSTMTFTADCQCTVVHLYSSSALAVNGSSGGNIVIRGWL